jgi:hypothetical protein
MEHFLYNVHEKQKKRTKIDTAELKATYVALADTIPDIELGEEYFVEDREYFEALTVKELKEIMKNLGITYSKMKKSELIDCLLSLNE